MKVYQLFSLVNVIAMMLKCVKVVVDQRLSIVFPRVSPSNRRLEREQIDLTVEVIKQLNA